MIVKNSCDAFYLVLKQLLGNSTCLYFILARCEVTFQGVMEELKLVGNTAKGRISKWAFRENKARQTFRKTKISYPLICTRTCAYQGVRNVRFSKNLTCFVFLKYLFWDSPFLPYYRRVSLVSPWVNSGCIVPKTKISSFFYV